MTGGGWIIAGVATRTVSISSKAPDKVCDRPVGSAGVSRVSSRACEPDARTDGVASGIGAAGWSLTASRLEASWICGVTLIEADGSAGSAATFDPVARPKGGASSERKSTGIDAGLGARWGFEI
jgi:hypothetical protein